MQYMQRRVCRTIWHIRYIRTNNTTSAYATHILNNRHEYGNASNTIQLLNKCNKGTRMNCWEAMYIHAYHQERTLLAEQQVTEHNPLFDLGNLETLIHALKPTLIHAMKPPGRHRTPKCVAATKPPIYHTLGKHTHTFF